MSGIFSNICPFSQLSFMQYMRRCVFSVSIYLLIIVWIFALNLITINFDIWITSHCFGLGHEKWYILCVFLFSYKQRCHQVYAFPSIFIIISWYIYVPYIYTYICWHHKRLISLFPQVTVTHPTPTTWLSRRCYVNMLENLGVIKSLLWLL